MPVHFVHEVGCSKELGTQVEDNHITTQHAGQVNNFTFRQTASFVTLFTQDWRLCTNFIEDFSVTTNGLGTPKKALEAARSAVSSFRWFITDKSLCSIYGRLTESIIILPRISNHIYRILRNFFGQIQQMNIVADCRFYYLWLHCSLRILVLQTDAGDARAAWQRCIRTHRPRHSRVCCT